METIKELIEKYSYMSPAEALQYFSEIENKIDSEYPPALLVVAWAGNHAGAIRTLFALLAKQQEQIDELKRIVDGMRSRDRILR